MNKSTFLTRLALGLTNSPHDRCCRVKAIRTDLAPNVKKSFWNRFSANQTDFETTFVAVRSSSTPQPAPQ